MERTSFLSGRPWERACDITAAIFPRVPDVSTAEAARLLNTTPPTIRTLLLRGELKGRRVTRGSRFAWLVDEASIAAHIASHGRFRGTRRPTAARIAALEHEVAALKTAIGCDASPSNTINRLGTERDDLRATVMSLQDALARMRSVAELQWQADAERSAMVDHLLAASAASERADAFRRSAVEQLEDAVAAAAQPARLS